MLINACMVEDWLQSRLLADARLSEAVAGRVHSVPGLPGSGEKQLEDRLKGLFARLPALGTYLPSGAWGFPGSPELQTETLEAWVLCAAANSREPGAALRGDPRGLGAWDLVEHVRRATTGLAPEHNVEGCTPLSWRLLWCNSQVAVCAVEMEIVIARPVAPVDLPEGWAGGAMNDMVNRK